MTGLGLIRYDFREMADIGYFDLRSNNNRSPAILIDPGLFQTASLLLSVYLLATSPSIIHPDGVHRSIPAFRRAIQTSTAPR